MVFQRCGYLQGIVQHFRLHYTLVTQLVHQVLILYIIKSKALQFTFYQRHLNTLKHTFPMKVDWVGVFLLLAASIGVR